MLRTNGFPMKHKVWAIVQQDNAPVHTSQVAMRSVWDCGFELPPHLPYSSDVVPSDYYFFFKIEKSAPDQIYDDGNELTYAMGEFTTERDSGFYRAGIDALPTRLTRCLVGERLCWITNEQNWRSCHLSYRCLNFFIWPSYVPRTKTCRSEIAVYISFA